jgi:hypothetical protein
MLCEDQKWILTWVLSIISIISWHWLWFWFWLWLLDIGLAVPPR